MMRAQCAQSTHTINFTADFILVLRSSMLFPSRRHKCYWKEGSLTLRVIAIGVDVLICSQYISGISNNTFIQITLVTSIAKITNSIWAMWSLVDMNDQFCRSIASDNVFTNKIHQKYLQERLSGYSQYPERETQILGLEYMNHQVN